MTEPAPSRTSAATSPARLTVLSGPTAVGKGTIMAEMRRRHPDLWISVSATTRPPRPGEVDGVHYHFISPERFDELVAGGKMLEWAVVHGRNRYGTPREPVERQLAAGRPVFLELDLQGARQVRQVMPEARFVFLAPPSWAELVHRLVGRGTEGPEERERRLATARQELAAVEEFDHVVVNDDVARATDEVLSLMGFDPQ
ncbi:guanylate kinase [Georgenia sp. AZ-5]|uniref:guanylate kinase n=1 Tax=Georgenia sp. AZ-5 TaxID=3367526 RepID=UPI0037544EB6